MKPNEIYFEISDGQDLLRLEPKSLVKERHEYNWDNNRVITHVIVKGGSFSGEFDAEFMTVDFEKFKQDLKPLLTDLTGTAGFSVIEQQLDLKIKGDGFGSFEIRVGVCDRPVLGSRMSFFMIFNQSLVKDLIAQLERITKQFPVIGDFSLKN